MNNSLIDLFQFYVKKEDERSEIQTSGELEALLDFCEYTIRT